MAQVSRNAILHMIVSPTKRRICHGSDNFSPSPSFFASSALRQSHATRWTHPYDLLRQHHGCSVCLKVETREERVSCCVPRRECRQRPVVLNEREQGIETSLRVTYLPSGYIRRNDQQRYARTIS